MCVRVPPLFARTDKRHHLSTPCADEISTMRLLYRATTHGTGLYSSAPGRSKLFESWQRKSANPTKNEQSVAPDQKRLLEITSASSPPQSRYQSSSTILRLSSAQAAHDCCSVITASFSKLAERQHCPEIQARSHSSASVGRSCSVPASSD